VREGGGLRVGEELTVEVLEEDTLAVDVDVRRIVRDWGAERVTEGEAEDVLDGRIEEVKEGLADDVLVPGPLRVRVGVPDEVLEMAEEAVPVLEVVMVRVAVAVELVVRVEVWDAVEAGELVAVLEELVVFVGGFVGGTDFVVVVLGDGGREAPADRVEVVVFVDVLDCVLVAVGMTPSARSATPISVEFQGDAATLPIAARSKSQRIVLLLSSADT